MRHIQSRCNREIIPQAGIGAFLSRRQNRTYEGDVLLTLSLEAVLGSMSCLISRTNCDIDLVTLPDYDRSVSAYGPSADCYRTYLDHERLWHIGLSLSAGNLRDDEVLHTSVSPCCGPLRCVLFFLLLLAMMSGGPDG